MYIYGSLFPIIRTKLYIKTQIIKKMDSKTLVDETIGKIEQDLEKIIRDPTIFNYSYYQTTYFNKINENPNNVFFSKLLNVLSFGNLNDYHLLRSSVPDGGKLLGFLNSSNCEFKLKSILVVKTIKSNYFKTWNKGSNKISYDVIANSICCNLLKTLETVFLKELISNDVIRGKLNSVAKSITVTQINFNRDILLESNVEYEKYSKRVARITDGGENSVMDLNYIRGRLEDFRTKNISNAFKVLEIFGDVRATDLHLQDRSRMSASADEFGEQDQSMRKGSLDTIIL